MQIVIDIPQKTNERIRSIVGHGIYNFFDDEDRRMVVKAIYDGIVLPENHGRLIDANFLIKQYEEYCKENCIYTENERNVMCRACGTGCAIEMLENAPTVLAATEGS